MSALCPQNRRRPLLWPLLGLCVATSSIAAPPRVLDRIPQGASAIVALDSINRFDQNSSQLLAAMDFHAISTLSQALGAMGLRDGLDLSGSAAGVFFDPIGVGSRYVLLLPMARFEQFLGNLKAQPDGPAFRFEYAGRTYFARDMGDGLAAFGPDRELVIAFDGARGQLEDHLNRIGPRGREVADRADLLVIADARALAPMLTSAIAPLLEGAPADGVTAIARPEGPPTAATSKLIESVINQCELALIGVQAGPLGLRLDIAAPFKPDSQLGALCLAAPARPSGLRALPRRDYVFLSSLNLSHPGLRRLILTAMEPAPDNAAPPQPLLVALGALASADSASIAVYSPPNLMMGVFTQSALTWESSDAPATMAAFGQSLAAMDARPMFAPRRPGEEAEKPLGPIRAEFSPAQPPFDVQADESVRQWTLALPPGGFPASVLLFGIGADPSGYVGATPTRGVITWSRDRALLESCMSAARDPDLASSALGDVMLSQVSALLPQDRCLEWFLNARPVLQVALPIISMTGQAPPLRLPEVMPPMGVSVSLADRSLHAAAFIPAPVLRVVIGAADRLNSAAARAQGGQDAPPR